MSAHPAIKTAIVDPADWSGSFSDALDRWNAAETQALEDAGKPFAEDGGERGSMSQDFQINLAKTIGVYDELIAAAPDFFGPTVPGVSA